MSNKPTTRQQVLEDNDKQQVAKIAANLLLNVKDVKWLLSLREEKTTDLLSYLVLGVKNNILPPSLARLVLAKYIEMRKHEHTNQ